MPPTSSPPPPPSAKILYEEGDTHDGLTTWSPSSHHHHSPIHRYRRKRNGPIIIAIIIALLMFILGFSTGAFVHAFFYPDGGSPLVQIPSFLLSSDNSTSTIYNSEEIEESEEELEDTVTKFVISVESAEKSKEEEEKEEEEEEEEEKEEEEEEKVKVELDIDDEAKSTEYSVDEFSKKHKQCLDIKWMSARLPTYAEPREYDLTIHPNIASGDIVGNVKILLSIKNNTDEIVLNAEEMEIDSYSIHYFGKEKEEPIESTFKECKILTQWVFLLNETVEKRKKIMLEINYKTKIRHDLGGLYFSVHTNQNGTKSVSIATQFEPTFAQRMVPCFDEPNFKAVFKVSIVREPNHVARSNMPIKVSKEYSKQIPTYVDIPENQHLIVDIFEKTVKMSTYLLAVAVLENYEYVKRIARNTKKQIEVRIYAPSDVLKGQSEFGLDTGIRALEFFEKYFDIAFPLQKIDMLALDDFSEGAMENWGLVTFRDSALLFNENKSSTMAKEHIALIICHEMAHQWFGNLVTMDWWDEVFLNEGFANYMEYKCVDELFPHWNIMTRFYGENLAFSQEPDGFLSTRAIESADDSLLNLFDAINYHKAAAIIHMIAEMVGQKNFQSALKEYLNKFTYANAKGVELWKIVGKHANLQSVDIPALARAYTTQIGYPLVNIEVQNSTITANNQTRFVFWESEKTDKTRGNHSWPIPLKYRTKQSLETQTKWFYQNEKNTSWELPEIPDWVVVNTGGVGYFKVQYDRKMYNKLIKQLKKNHTAIGAIDRSMLLIDAFDLARTSNLEIDVWLDMVEYAENENDKMAWTIINKQMRLIETLIEGTEHMELFRDFQRSLILRLYESFEWDQNQSTPSQKGLQIEAFVMACRLRIRDCRKQAYNRYQKWLSDGLRFPDFHGVVLDEGIHHGGKTSWERIWQHYSTVTNPSERNNIVSALAGSKDPELINKLLRLCLEGKIKTNLLPRVFSSLSLNEIGRATAWRFLKQHFNEIHELLGTGSSLLPNIIRSLSEPLSTQDDLDELKKFLKEKFKEEEGQMKMEQTFEQVDLNIQWRNLNEKRLGEWLNKWDVRRRKLSRRRRHHHR